MALACLQAKCIFGLRSNVRHNIQFIDENTVAYPCGINCTYYNIDQRSQQHIPPNPKGKGISCLAVSKNRQYLAIAERGDRPLVSIYDAHLRKRVKLLATAEVASKEYICMSFSADDKHFLVQGGAPDWTMAYWYWEKSKLLGVLCTSNVQNMPPIHQVEFNPFENHVFGVVGSGIFKTVRFMDGSFKITPSPKTEGQQFACMQWASEERILAGTEQGTIFIMDNVDPRNVIPINKMVRLEAPSESLKAEKLEELPEYRMVPLHYRVTSIQVISKGFLVACGPGCVYLFEKHEKEHYKQSRVIKIPQDPMCPDPTHPEEQIITHMTVSPTEEMLVASTDQLQLYYYHFAGFELSKSFQVLFEYMTQPFHSKAIIDIDVCIRKPLIVTCSVDQTIRVWNYETCTEVIHKEFSEEVLCTSIHPGGLFMIAGFDDRLRMLNILIDDIRVFKEIPMRGCRSCAFNHGGSHFAALHGSIIQIFSSISLDLIQSLKGHHTKVTGITWSQDDTKLVSCGGDGAVYEWEPITAKRVGDSVVKGCNYLSVDITPDNKVAISISSDKAIKEITESQVIRQLTFRELMTSVKLSHSGRYLFVSTAVGGVWAVKIPLTQKGEIQEYRMHGAAITKIKITFDDQYLVTGAEDGTLCIWKVVDREGRSLKRDREMVYAEETLITQVELEEKNSIIKELKTRVNELKLESEYQMRLKDMKYADKMREMTERFTVDMDTLQKKLQAIQEEKDKQTVTFEEDLRNMSDKFLRELEEQESLSNHKLILEYEKFHELQSSSNNAQTEFDSKISELDGSKQRALVDLTQHYERKLREKAAQLDMVREQSQIQHVEYNELSKQIEEDADREILDIKTRFERKLKEERDANIRLKAESQLLKKKFVVMQKEIEEQKLTMQRTLQEQTKLQYIIKSLEKDIATLKKEITDRDSTIQEKETHIFDLKKKSQELEKFKFVLEYKIKELKKQLDPKDQLIKEMKDQISSMEVELNQFRVDNQNLLLEIAELKEKLHGLDKEMREGRVKAVDLETALNRLKTDVYRIVANIQNPKKLKQGVKELYHKHVQVLQPGSYMEDDLDILSEHMRQREHLEHTVISLRKKLNKDTKLHYSDYVRITKQNVILIKEINDLRQELKTARGKLSDLDKILGTDKGKMDRAEAQHKLQSIIQQVKEAVAERETKLEEKERIIDMQCKEMGELYAQLQKDAECPQRRIEAGYDASDNYGVPDNYGVLSPPPFLPVHHS